MVISVEKKRERGMKGGTGRCWVREQSEKGETEKVDVIFSSSGNGSLAVLCRQV